jgi:hypothetical protein
MLITAFRWLTQFTQSPDAVLWSGADTTTQDWLYKEIFSDELSEGVNNEFPLKDFFEKIDASEDFKGGRGTKWKMHVSRNVSPFFTREGAAFAVAGKQGGVEGTIDQRKLMARVKMTAEAMIDSTSTDAAIVSGKKDELTRAIDDIAWREEGALGMDGRGILCLLNGDPGTGVTPAEVDTPGNIVNASFGNRFIQKDMFLAAINPVGPVLRAGITQVLDVNQDGTDWTPATAYNAAWGDNDYLVQAANGSVTDILDTSYEAAYWGLPALVDDGTNRNNYFGVDRSLVPAAKSYVNASTGALSTDLLQRIADVLYQKLGAKVNLLSMHPSIRRLVIQLTEQDRRYQGASLMKPDPGTVAFQQGDLTMGEVPIKAIRSLPLDQIYFLDTKKAGFKRYVSEEGKWADEDGSIWIRDGVGTSATDAYEAWYRRRQQYFVQNPGCCGRADAITGQTLVVVRAE